jgi:hypothetical protein
MDNLWRSILNVFKEREEIYFLELLDFIPQIHGEYAIYAPLKEGYNPNVLLLSGVSVEFIDAFNGLVQENQILEVEPRHIWEALFDGSPIYRDIPVVTIGMAKNGNSHCWMPAVLRKRKKVWEQENFGNPKKVAKAAHFSKKTAPKIDDKFTYLIHDPSTNLTKIGQSLDPERRLNDIKSHNPVVKLLWYSKSKSEKELHEQFDKKRHFREWFKLSDTDIKHITSDK